MNDTVKKLLPYLLAAAAVLFAVFGIININKQNTYADAEATITKFETIESANIDDPDTVEVTVKYTIDGKDYESELGSYTADMQVGQTVKIKYDPANPQSIVQSGPTAIIVTFAVAAVLLVAAVITFVARKNGKL